MGALLMLMVVQVSVDGLYLPPVLKEPRTPPAVPPHTIISLPVQIAVCQMRAEGALTVLTAVQLPVLGLYLPPVFKALLPSDPPHTIISLPVQTAV